MAGGAFVIAVCFALYSQFVSGHMVSTVETAKEPEAVDDAELEGPA